jgi:hypothetical protein
MRDRSPSGVESRQRHQPAALREGTKRAIRPYRIALFASVALNALLVTALWLYLHYAGTLSMIEDVVGMFN